jgi:hypothetical protein
MKPSSESCQPSLDPYFNREKDGTPRLITTISSARGVYPMVQGRQILSDAAMKAREHHREIEFFDKGIKSVLRNDEEIQKVSHTLALFRFNRDQHYIADMFTGLYTMLTRGEKFLDIKHILARDPETGKEYLRAIQIVTTIPTLYKAALGPLLDRNARSIRGAYEIVHDAKKIIDPILYGKAPMPRATVTLRDVKKSDGSLGDVWISGEPIHIHRASQTSSDLVAVDLDCEFAPVLIEGNKIRAGDQFISNVAGLTAMLQLGKRYVDSEVYYGQSGINCNTAKRIILAIQAGIELGRITGLGVEKNSSNRLNITLRKKALPNIVPDAIRYLGKANERPNYREVSNAVSKAGQYLYKAIEKTEILNMLNESNKAIYIPATKLGAEFPGGEDYKNIVYFKADPLNN